jgi:hypothetical protein
VHHCDCSSCGPEDRVGYPHLGPWELHQRFVCKKWASNKAPGSFTKGLSGKSLENGPQICYGGQECHNVTYKAQCDSPKWVTGLVHVAVPQLLYYRWSRNKCPNQWHTTGSEYMDDGLLLHYTQESSILAIA